MFDFNKTQFNFNSISENKHTTYGLVLDDFDDEFEDDIQSQKDIIDTEMDFRIFLKVNVFNPICVDIDPKSGNLLNGVNRCAWKTYSDNGEKHYLAYINIIQNGNSKRYEHDLYIDLNDKTKELHIGNCTTYKSSKFLNISYPLIKICEHYKDGQVYIGCINFDKPFSTKTTATDILNCIEIPIKYLSISETVSFWRTVWNGKGYYLPDYRPGMKLAEIENNLKLPTDFVSHFGGFDSKFASKIKVPIFYNMFESFNDFAKIIKILCDQNALVFTEFGIEMTKTDYNEKIKLFANKLNDKLILIQKRNQKLADNENFARNYLLEILPQNVIDHFDSINLKSPSLLSVKTLSKERKSKDPYRKLDFPIVKLILKDNGIDIDKIVNNYEEQWLTSFYKFVNIFYQHCKKLKINSEKNQYNVYQEYNYIINNIFERYDRMGVIKYTDENGDKQLFDGLTNEELSLIKDIIFGLKPNLELLNYRELVIDTQRLDDPNDEALAYICRELLNIFGEYNGQLLNDDIDNHTYNEFLIIQRFLYLLYNQYVDDYNANIDESDTELEKADPEILYNMKHSYVEFSYYNGSYYPFNFGDINMKLNTYNQLYKFLTFISYIIENGYDIHCPNIGGYVDSKEKILAKYGMNDYDCDCAEDLNKFVQNEFSLNNKPNIKLLNMDSIIKMFSTIFTNIDKKI